MMTGNQYQQLAMRTNDGKGTERLEKMFFLLRREDKPDCYNPIAKDIGGVINACLGLSGEVGELNDMIKKWIFHEKETDVEHLKREAGDIAWYLAMLCESFGWELDEIFRMNIDKLKARYPDGFDTVRANNRHSDDV